MYRDRDYELALETAVQYGEWEKRYVAMVLYQAWLNSYVVEVVE